MERSSKALLYQIAAWFLDHKMALKRAITLNIYKAIFFLALVLSVP